MHWCSQFFEKSNIVTKFVTYSTKVFEFPELVTGSQHLIQVELEASATFDPAGLGSFAIMVEKSLFIKISFSSRLVFQESKSRPH